MSWATIKAEPLGLGPAPQRDDALYYLLQLPIIRDGRLSLPLLLRNPERAVVFRYRTARSKTRGLLRYIDNQCICEWPAGKDAPPDIRLIGARFAIGDTIGLRPKGGALALFRVAEHLPLDIAARKPLA